MKPAHGFPSTSILEEVITAAMDTNAATREDTAHPADPSITAAAIAATAEVTTAAQVTAPAADTKQLQITISERAPEYGARFFSSYRFLRSTLL